jgi:hypothetical protein
LFRALKHELSRLYRIIGTDSGSWFIWLAAGNHVVSDELVVWTDISPLHLLQPSGEVLEIRSGSFITQNGGGMTCTVKLQYRWEN